MKHIYENEFELTLIYIVNTVWKRDALFKVKTELLCTTIKQIIWINT